MRILMAKCHKRTIFSKLEPIITEPLELEYLASVLDNLSLQYRIYDSIIEDDRFEDVFEKYAPEVLILSGYVTAVDKIIEWSKYTKRNNENIKVIVGGVHAEVNYRDFFCDTIDYIIHSDGINTLEELFKSNFNTEKINYIDGIAFQHHGQWRVNNKVQTFIENMPLPNRSYFSTHKYKTKYLLYSPVAIIKTSLSCPYSCNFCYCKKLNMGSYSVRTIESVIEEIKKIESEYIWIVDDSFLINRERILRFIHEIEKNNINKKFIAYSRVDFIAKNEDIISKLSDIGFIELIVGMEAIEDRKLEDFNKNSLVNENIRTIEILNKYNINLTALFIVNIDFKLKDFINMRKWIRKMKLKSYTASIFTPMKGTEIYKKYEDKIINKEYSKLDFLHLTMKPLYMSRASFYFQFYLIYIQLFFQSKYIRNYVFKSWRNIFSFGGRHE